MHEVFINYRTGDGDETAVMLEKELSERFGEDRIFRAATSIAPGQSFAERLLDAAQSSQVLLCVIGPDWSRHPRLRHEDDWVRKEIIAARDRGVRVIPVLKGRKMDRLAHTDLPGDLTWLADVQSLRLDTRDNRADLARIGDMLSRFVPSLQEADKHAPPAQDSGEVRNESSDVSGTAIQGRNFSGGVGPIITGSSGTFHAGSGDINQHTQHFTGDGATNVFGNVHGGTSRPAERPHDDRDDEDSS